MLSLPKTTIDRRFLLWAAVWTVASLFGFGIVSAIIPNPVFGRQIPPEPFAIAVWLISAPLMGLVAATYTAPPSASLGARALLLAPQGAATGQQGSTLGAIASLGAFLAIGCPICNKVALLLLGTSGALTIYAPLQPALGAVSLVILTGTLVWRFRQRARGGACVLPG
jgi:hypothetical protein